MFATRIFGTDFSLDITFDRTDEIPVPVRSLFRRIIIHMPAPPDTPAVLTLFKNFSNTSQKVTVPTTIPVNSGIELSWPTPLLFLPGELAFVRTEGNPTATANAHVTFIFDRDLRPNAPRSNLTTEFAMHAATFTTGIHQPTDICERIPVPEKAFLKRAVLRIPGAGPDANTTLTALRNGTFTNETIIVLQNQQGGKEYAFPNPILYQKGDLATLFTTGESTNTINPRVTFVFDRSGVP